MFDRQRCLDLIQGAPGSMDERLECAQNGYWGNQPKVVINGYGAVVSSPVFSAQPVDEWWDRNLGKGSLMARKCGGNCGCSGAAGGAGGVGQGGGLAGVGGSFGGHLGSSSLGFNWNLSGLLLLIVVLMLVMGKKGR